jgi:hypothetical protein
MMVNKTGPLNPALAFYPLTLSSEEWRRMDTRRRERWANQPMVQLSNRDSLIRWLQWNDPNGDYDDESGHLQGMKPMTLADAQEAFNDALREMEE